MYANGEDRVLVPNGVVLSGAIVPLREPSGVDMRARLDARVKPSEDGSARADEVVAALDAVHTAQQVG